MDQTPHTPPDGLDKLLQKYLLERNPLGPDGKPLMEAARRTALGSAPVVTPAKAREAEMLRRLETRVAELPKPGPAGIGAGMRWALFTVTTAAVVTTVSLLLWLKPFRNTETGNPNVVSMLAEKYPPSEAQSGTQSATAPWVSTAPLTSEEVKERSLQRSNQEQGSGNPDLNPDRDRSRNGSRSANSTNAPQLSDEGHAMTAPAPPVTTPAHKPTAPAASVDLFPLKSIFQSLIPEVSGNASFDNNKGWLMETPRGTLLHFPAGAFVTLSGLPVTQPVDVKVREAYERSDFLRANLAGLPGENPFVNGGAIEITATAGGQPVMLASGKDIYVVYARNGATTPEQLRNYAGFRNETGRMAWTASGELASRMVPLSATDMHFNQFWCYDRDVVWNDLLGRMGDGDARNPLVGTWVYTLEFRDRVRAAHDMGHAAEILKMYLANTDKELWIVDQMVAQALKQNPASLSNQAHGKNGSSIGVADAETFFRFAEQRKSTVASYKVPSGVDLNAVDALKRLQKAGLSPGDASRILRIHDLRKVFSRRISLAAVADPRPKNPDGPRYRPVSGMPDLSISNSYHLRQLGWNLRSEPLIIPPSKSVPLKVKAPGMAAGSRAWIVMESGNVIAEGQPTADGFVFTSLPKGVDAKVVVMGGSEQEPVAGIADVQVGKTSQMTVNVAPMKMVKLDRELNLLDQ